jgi:hypothetical protein
MDSVRRSAGTRPSGWFALTPTPVPDATLSDDTDTPPPPFGPAAVTRYRCTLCGSVEEWVEAEADLVIIRLFAVDPPDRPRTVAE